MSHLISCRDCIWELYHADCLTMPQVLRNHPNVNLITGLKPYFLCNILWLGVEIDMPFYDGLEETYGPTFKPWTEAEFINVIRILYETLPHANLAVVVTCLLFSSHIPFRCFTMMFNAPGCALSCRSAMSSCRT